MQVGERIREIREIRKYTREELAEMADISEKFLYEIEVGRKGFSADTLCRLAKALSVSCDYIMYGIEGEKERQSIENIACVLEILEPEQISKIEEILKILYDMCEEM